MRLAEEVRTTKETNIQCKVNLFGFRNPALLNKLDSFFFPRKNGRNKQIHSYILFLMPIRHFMAINKLTQLRRTFQPCMSTAPERAIT